MYPHPLFTIFGQDVMAYGVCMAIGIIACFGFLMFTMWYKKFNEDATDKILLIGLFGTGFGIFSAMLFQSVYNYISNPDNGFHLSGLTFIGGLIGGVVSFLAVYFLYIYVIAPRTKIKFLQNNMNATLTDALPFIPIGICIAHAFGRLGCFFAGCCYGSEVSEGGWGLPVAVDKPGVLVVPTQLYEMLFLILLAAVMAILYFKFKLNYNFGVYSICYGIWRFCIEFVRDDSRGEIWKGASITPSQFWSIIMVILGIGYFFLQYYVLAKQMKHPELAVNQDADVSAEIDKAEAVPVSEQSESVESEATEGTDTEEEKTDGKKGEAVAVAEDTETSAGTKKRGGKSGAKKSVKTSSPEKQEADEDKSQKEDE